MKRQVRTEFVSLIVVSSGNFLAQAKTLTMPYWLQELMTEGKIGQHLTQWISSFEFVINAIAICLAMQIMFRVSQLTILVGAGLALVLGNSLCLLVPNEFGFFAGRAIAALGEGFIFALVQAIAAQHAAPQRAYSIMNATLLMFSFAILLLIPTTIQYAGATGIFALMVASAVIGIPLLMLGEPRSLHQWQSDLRRPKARGPVIASMIVVVIASVGMAGLWSYSVIVGQKLGISGQYISRAMVVSLFTGIAGSALALKMALRPGVALSFVLFAIASALFGYGGSTILYLSTICFITCASGLAIPLLFTLLARLDRSGSAAALAPVAVMVGSAIGAFAIGLAIDANNYATFFYTYLAALCAGYGLVVYSEMTGNRLDENLAIRLVN